MRPENSVNCVKMFLGDGRLCAGGGATELELARQLYSIGESCPGMEQYAMKKFAESLEVVPRTLAENSGQLATEAISALYAAHQAGETNHGVDIGDGSAQDMFATGVLDVLATKRSAIKLAADAAITVLRVDTVRPSQRTSCCAKPGSETVSLWRVFYPWVEVPLIMVGAPDPRYAMQIIMAKQAGGPKGG